MLPTILTFFYLYMHFYWFILGFGGIGIPTAGSRALFNPDPENCWNPDPEGPNPEQSRNPDPAAGIPTGSGSRALFNPDPENCWNPDPGCPNPEQSRSRCRNPHGIGILSIFQSRKLLKSRSRNFLKSRSRRTLVYSIIIYIYFHFANLSRRKKLVMLNF
jgi:hypothetical protein